MSATSMTGFGSATENLGSATLNVEIRTLNHRFLEIFVHLAPELPRSWELLARKRIEDRLARGRVDVYVEARTSPEERRALRVDRRLAEAYHIALNELAETRDLPVELGAADLAQFPGVMELEEVDPGVEDADPSFAGALDRALDAVVEMREREGQSLGRVLEDLLAGFSECLRVIEDAAPELERRRYEIVLERVNRLLTDSDAQIPDLAGEVALIAQRSSVSEELDRLRSHLDQLNRVLEGAGPMGRNLDFLVGEMGRECNTVAAKIADAEMNRVALDMKGYLEDMREQARNIE